MKYEFKDEKEARDYWYNYVSSCHDGLKKKWEDEADRYFKAFRHEFGSYHEDVAASSRRVDVNIVFPVVKSLITNVYYRDPKVFISSEQDKIVVPVTELVQDEITQEEREEQVINQMTGAPMVKEFDGTESAKSLEKVLNDTIEDCELKKEIKQALTDAEVGFYGAIDVGFGNDQGVASMGEGAPPSIKDGVLNNMPHALRLEPWNVVVDANEFYSPHWIAVEHCVPPEQLKNDKRLKRTEKIEGKTSYDSITRETYYKNLKDEDIKLTKYYSIFVKPCAAYPEGKFYMVSNEVEDGFLFESSWPYENLKKLPIMLLYFNRDPRGGLPTPGVRYYFQQQNAKNNMRNAMYEYVQRSLPTAVINTGAIKNQETVSRQYASGQIPRVITVNQKPENAFGLFAAPALPADFYNLDSLIDSDTARVSVVSPFTPTQDEQLATSLKIASGNEAMKTNERTDILTDFLKDIFKAWVELLKEFRPDMEYLQGVFKIKIKPFSMTFEDPVILRKHYVDLMNIMASPEARLALAEQGARVNLVSIVKRLLETYQENDIENFLEVENQSPEVQVLDALQENQAAMEGQGFSVMVEETDNDKIHILIHQQMGPLMSEHIIAHQQNMMKKLSGAPTSGGGNPEGLPINGVAANQDLLNSPALPSPKNQGIAIEREAYKA